MRHIVALLLPVAALPALASPPIQVPVRQLAPADLVRTMGIEPGSWLVHGTIDTIDVRRVTGTDPLPADMTAGIARSRGVSRDTHSCVPRGLMPNGRLSLPGIEIGGGCTYRTLQARGGHLRMLAVCGTGPDEVHAETRVEANYSARTMAGTITVDAVTPWNGGYNIHTSMTLRASYEGATCPPDPPPAH